MNWPASSVWLHTIADDEARRAARLDSRRAWLLHLRALLGPYFGLHETQAVAAYVSGTGTKVRRVLGTLAQFPLGEMSRSPEPTT